MTTNNDTTTNDQSLVGTTVTHSESGRTGTVLERNEDETLVRWNGGTGNWGEWRDEEDTEGWVDNDEVGLTESE